MEGIASMLKSLELKDRSEIDTQRQACHNRAEQEFDKKCVLTST